MENEQVILNCNYRCFKCLGLFVIDYMYDIGSNPCRTKILRCVNCGKVIFN